ncbi:hypothetical protein ACT7C0_27610 [Bacillus cereus]
MQKKRKVDDYDRFRELLQGCEGSNNRIIEDHLGASLAKGKLSRGRGIVSGKRTEV